MIEGIQWHDTMTIDAENWNLTAKGGAERKGSGNRG